MREAILDQVAYRYTDGTALDRVMAFYGEYVQEFQPFVSSELCLAGSPGEFKLSKKNYAGLCHDIGHYCANYAMLVTLGVDGLRSKIQAGEPNDLTGMRNKAAFLEILELFVRYMSRHADTAEAMAQENATHRATLLALAANIHHICERKPESFIEGLQLIWFAHSFILLKPYTDTITYGNLDRILAPLYEADLQAGRLDRQEACRIICHFYLLSETMYRDTQNIALGGSSENGEYFENDLTLLFLEAQKALHLEQPSLSLKIRPDTSDALWEAALDLISLGGAMPSFLNDKVYIDALRRCGFDEAEANTYCNVGCYEATPTGNTFGGTVSGSVTLPTEFAAFFANGIAYDDFDSFLLGWETHITKRYQNEIVPSYRYHRATITNASASPFTACIMSGCVESFRLPEQFGAKHNIFSVLFGGIATLVDSLLCVKHFVYDTKAYTLNELRAQVADNFSDDTVLATIRAYPLRFGSNDAYSNTLAAKEARLLARLATENPIHDKTKMLPALFIFTGWADDDRVPATPDGRRYGDRYSYGASASELLPHRDITKVLLSSAHLPLEVFPIGAPQTVHLTADLLHTAKGREAAKQMVKTYFGEGGTHLQIEVARPEVLRDAQKHPERYSDLLIRISGHTEHFIRLNKKMQDALIARAELG